MAAVMARKEEEKRRESLRNALRKVGDCLSHVKE